MLGRTLRRSLTAQNGDEGGQLALVESLSCNFRQLEHLFAGRKVSHWLGQGQANGAHRIERLEDGAAVCAIHLEAARRRTRLHRRDVEDRQGVLELERADGVVGVRR